MFKYTALIALATAAFVHITMGYAHDVRAAEHATRVATLDMQDHVVRCAWRAYPHDRNARAAFFHNTWVNDPSDTRNTNDVD